MYSAHSGQEKICHFCHLYLLYNKLKSSVKMLQIVVKVSEDIQKQYKYFFFGVELNKPLRSFPRCEADRSSVQY